MISFQIVEYTEQSEIFFFITKSKRKKKQVCFVFTFSLVSNDVLAIKYLFIENKIFIDAFE